MAFVPVPKDLNRVKTKVMFNLTKRQLICFALAAAVGVPIFFLTKPSLSLSTSAMLMVVNHYHHEHCCHSTEARKCRFPDGIHRSEV